MYFDFDDRHDHYQPLGGRSRGVAFLFGPVAVYSLVFLLFLIAPTLEILARPLIQPEQERPQPKRENKTFVFVDPRVDLPALRPPKRPEYSDKDRTARNEVKKPLPPTPLPYARGNSPERVEAAPDLRARGRGPEPEPAPTPPTEPAPPREVQPPPSQQAQLSVPQQTPMKPAGGSLGEALKNLQKYVQQESFNNQRGNVQDLGPLQFDTKGIEFGPWIRRFVAQVRRNWFIPYAAMTMRGHVVLTFNVHKSGALTDVQVIQPSAIDSFNTAAMNALLASNPTEPLPPEYPEPKAFFTVTFYYNESPSR